MIGYCQSCRCVVSAAEPHRHNIGAGDELFCKTCCPRCTSVRRVTCPDLYRLAMAL